MLSSTSRLRSFADGVIDRILTNGTSFVSVAARRCYRLAVAAVATAAVAATRRHHHRRRCRRRCRPPPPNPPAIAIVLGQTPTVGGHISVTVCLEPWREAWREAYVQRPVSGGVWARVVASGYCYCWAPYAGPRHERGDAWLRSMHGALVVT